METVEVVIKIPKKCKEFLDNGGKVDWLDAISIIDAIANGIPLPERHGRLIDVNNLCIAIAARMFNIEATNSIPIKDLQDVIDNAPTIIEVDKE